MDKIRALPIQRRENGSVRTERRIAVVCFSSGGKGYDYFCDDEAVQEGDRVIVEGYDGETEVEVVETTRIGARAAAQEIQICFAQSVKAKDDDGTTIRLTDLALDRTRRGA